MLSSLTVDISALNGPFLPRIQIKINHDLSDIRMSLLAMDAINGEIKLIGYHPY